MTREAPAQEVTWPRWAHWLGAHPRGRKAEPHPWIRAGLLLGGAVPFVSIAARGLTDQLGANPIAEAENQLGLTALVFLVATMACTPARALWRWSWPMRIRRQLGLWTFFYASTHFATYVFLDQVLDVNAILADVVERPFITVGFLAFLLLVPIAYTSSNEWVRKLGYMRWLRVHQLVYLAVPLAVLHFIWRVKIDVSQPLLYAAIFGALFAVRIGFWLKRRAG